MNARAADLENAIATHKRALALKPDDAEACYALAQALETSGKPDIAIKTYDHWLKIIQAGSGKPPMVADEATIREMERLVAQGKAHVKRGELEKAKAAYEKLLLMNPDSPAGLSNLAFVLFYMQRLDEAVKMLLHCLRIKPHYANALNILGGCLKDTKRTLAAIAAYKQCLAIDPNFANAWSNLGKCYLDTNSFNESVEAHEKAIALDPGHADSMGCLLHLLHYNCEWKRVETLKQTFLDALKAGNSTEPFLAAVHIPENLLDNTRRWAKQKFPGGFSYDENRILPSDMRKDGKLRIGYLSSDLQRHATTALIGEMFGQHDRSKFEIYAYSYGQDDNGPERRRVMQSVNVFRDIVNMRDTEASVLMESDGIDILVDLKGYTSNHRLGVVARRPAPLQMHYLGYPGTIGADFVDYFISDGVTTPEGTERWFHEKLIRLPMSYQINDRMRPLPTPRPRSYYQLPEDGLVLCDFNSVYKITPELFEVWMRVLKAVPNSVLWLLITNVRTAMNLRNEAAKLGVDARRIILGGQMNLADHLSRYQHVDLCLDTTPCSGHTTTSDALWCGAPVVAITGESFAGRVAAGLLHSVGLPELVTNSLEEYEAKIIALAENPKKLKELRRYLEEGRMTFPLFDSAATTKAIESAYLRAAELHRQGKKPEHFSV